MEKARKDEQKMNQKQIIGAVVAAGLFIVTGVSSVLTNTLSERMLADTAKKTEDALLGGNTTTFRENHILELLLWKGRFRNRLLPTVYLILWQAISMIPHWIILTG